jgi:hypothetical protein
MATCDDDQVLNLEKKKEKNKTLDGHMWWWSSAQLGKEEREKQNPREIKAKV